MTQLDDKIREALEETGIESPRLRGRRHPALDDL